MFNLQSWTFPTFHVHAVVPEIHTRGRRRSVAHNSTLPTLFSACYVPRLVFLDLNLIYVQSLPRTIATLLPACLPSPCIANTTISVVLGTRSTTGDLCARLMPAADPSAVHSPSSGFPLVAYVFARDRLVLSSGNRKISAQAGWRPRIASVARLPLASTLAGVHAWLQVSASEIGSAHNSPRRQNTQRSPQTYTSAHKGNI